MPSPKFEVPRDAGSNIKTLYRDPKYRLALNFLRYSLCGDRAVEFVMPDDAAVMAHRNGRRLVWLEFEMIAEAPMPTETPPEGPARTMTEKARRRTISKTD